MPNVMVALPNICGALCSTPQSLADAHCRNQLKFAGVPQTPEPISAVSRPKFTILVYEDMWRTYCCLTSFSDCRTCLSCEDITRQSYAMVPRWRFLATYLRAVFSTSSVQHVSDLRLKLPLRPYHVWKYGRHPICDG